LTSEQDAAALMVRSHTDTHQLVKDGQNDAVHRILQERVDRKERESKAENNILNTVDTEEEIDLSFEIQIVIEGKKDFLQFGERK